MDENSSVLSTRKQKQFNLFMNTFASIHITLRTNWDS